MPISFSIEEIAQVFFSLPSRCLVLTEHWQIVWSLFQSEGLDTLLAEVIRFPRANFETMPDDTIALQPPQCLIACAKLAAIPNFEKRYDAEELTEEEATCLVAYLLGSVV